MDASVHDMSYKSYIKSAYATCKVATKYVAGVACLRIMRVSFGSINCLLPLYSPTSIHECGHPLVLL